MNNNRDIERDALALCLREESQYHPVCKWVSFAPQRLRVFERAKRLQLSEASRCTASRAESFVADVVVFVVCVSIMFVLCGRR